METDICFDVSTLFEEPRIYVYIIYDHEYKRLLYKNLQFLDKYCNNLPFVSYLLNFTRDCKNTQTLSEVRWIIQSLRLSFGESPRDKTVRTQPTFSLSRRNLWNSWFRITLMCYSRTLSNVKALKKYQVLFTNSSLLFSKRILHLFWRQQFKKQGRERET